MVNTCSAARGVVFDLDGVLVLSEHLWEEGWTAYAAQRGYSWTEDDTRQCQGMSVAEWSAYLIRRTSGEPRDAADAVIAHVAAAYRSGEVSLLEGAAELVATVASRVPIALATSAPRTIIDTVMATMGLGPHFSATVSSAEVRAGKPAPDVYVEAANRIGIDPAVSFAVEDSSNGVRAAAAAGLSVLAIEHDRYPLAADAAALALSVHRSLDQILDQLIRRLGADATADHRGMGVAP
jgi:HAD superfamily hydrolase (TIGR01509 family)